ncbi:MAG: TMEM175 family protein [Solirubrobacterales bacterium]
MAEQEERRLPLLERGNDLSRIFAFTDGVYAIAITLLVLQIEVPTGVTDNATLWEGIGDESADLFAFALSFLVIGMNWVGAHRFMRTVREYDRGLMLLTLLSLFWIVLIPFTSQLMGEYADQAKVATLIYIINMLMVVVAAALMQRHVLKAGLGKPEYAWDTELSLKSTIFTAAVFVVTMPVAFLVGSWVFLLWFGLRWDPYQRQRSSINKRLKQPDSTPAG